MTDRLFDNLHLWNPEPEGCAGMFTIPIIAGETALPQVEAWLPITCMGNFTPRTGCQLYSHDYQLARLWNDPERYIPILGRAACTLAPDFSLYPDTPTVLQVYAHYKKHWLAALWQRHGLTVYPTICWSDEQSFVWCFDGEPTRSVVSVSSVGTQRSGDTKAAFLKGYDAMLERLEPSAVLFFGNVPQGARGNIIPIPAFQEQIRRRLQHAVSSANVRRPGCNADPAHHGIA